MAKISGYDGHFTFGTSTVSDAKHNIISWSAEIACDALDVTGFKDDGQRTYIRGLRGWTATAEGLVDATNSIAATVPGTAAALKLYVNSTNYYAGDALCTGASPSVAVDGVETISFSFQGLSDLVYT